MSDELENTGKILIYQNEKGDTRIDVYFEEDTIWMTQKAMCELYQVAKSSVSEHISNIFKDSELEPEATVRKFRTVQIEGTRQVTRKRDYYNLHDSSRWLPGTQQCGYTLPSLGQRCADRIYEKRICTQR